MGVGPNGGRGSATPFDVRQQLRVACERVRVAEVDSAGLVQWQPEGWLMGKIIDKVRKRQGVIRARRVQLAYARAMYPLTFTMMDFGARVGRWRAARRRT